MTTVTTLLRYPLKSHGLEALAQVDLSVGEAMPYDRLWAVAHEASEADGSSWVPCAHFSRVSKAPKLMAITCTYDPGSGRLTLRHPDRPDLTFDPDGENARFIDWVLPLVPRNRALPKRIVKLPGHGFTDSAFASVTLCNHASHRAVETQADSALSIHRWRGNIWFDTETPWTEFDWIGREVRVGNAILKVRERTDRCLATTTNPETGERDADTLAALRHWGHQDFSVRAEVIESGTIRVGDPVVML